jgi:hypothetical protein
LHNSGVWHKIYIDRELDESFSLFMREPLEAQGQLERVQGKTPQRIRKAKPNGPTAVKRMVRP